MNSTKAFKTYSENNLKKLRKEKGLTQSELCINLQKYDCYLERSTYSKYETGARIIPINTLVSFAHFFDTSIEYIIGITENSEPIKIIPDSH